MYQVNNRINITSPDHLAMLRERFSNATESMSRVPGFVSFRLLEAEDGSHILVETVFKSKEDFRAWVESDHFKRAHGGRTGDADGPDLSSYYVRMT
ncbi:antibiotic biosynthesis monooxygenase family protein [Laceyella sacchari]|jgi:heme oxygenase (staphylobilin-producing)|uniref:Antibiotic biosynthesis monooxygenase n=1 Tax=Laceyella sacchari TaxID=37482 RepID=A0ABY5U2N3_LACSH|nr:antibiotic biosynthesis monooxygenase family protein [Laceyella sacchari]TCW35780.1 heme oxygenase (staphylobilin-producing) [Laceyella sacchari]UWE03912.1 antibiotic biosynthesis monooxygenase [Laceyella sacchari]